jgi:hypothetical protein
VGFTTSLKVLKMTPTQQIELSIDAAKELLKDTEALDRLYKNKDFIRLIEKKYLQEEPVRLTHLLADPVFSTDAMRNGVIKQLDGVAQFLGFLRGINRLGPEVRQAIADSERELDLLRTEQEG